MLLATVLGAGVAAALVATALVVPAVLRPARVPTPYPPALLDAYRTTAPRAAGCPLLIGHVRGAASYVATADTFDVSYPSGVSLSFSVGTTEDIEGTSVVLNKSWRGQIRSIAREQVELVDGECIVSVSTNLLDPNRYANEVAIAAGLRPVAGQPTAPPPPLPTPSPPPPVAPPVPTLVSTLEATFGGSDQVMQCGDADVDVAGSKATPGCKGISWESYNNVDGSDLSLWVSDYATPTDATYQFGINRKYMRQYAGTTIDTTLARIANSFFILTNNGQQCEAAFRDGNRVFVLNASARGDTVAKDAQDAVRAAILQARAAELKARSHRLSLGNAASG